MTDNSILRIIVTSIVVLKLILMILVIYACLLGLHNHNIIGIDISSFIFMISLTIITIIGNSDLNLFSCASVQYLPFSDIFVRSIMV